MNECSIGFFEHEGTTYAGKNWEPGLGYFSTVLKSGEIGEPALLYMGMERAGAVNIAEEIYSALEEDRILHPEDLVLYEKKSGEELPEGFSTKHRNGAKHVSGTFPSEQFSSEPEDPVQPILMMPTDGFTSVGVASPFNLDEWWLGINEEGVWSSSSALKHRGRSDYGPYSDLTDRVLSYSGSASEARSTVEDGLLSGEVKGVNFLVADGEDQYITEYVPGSAVGSPEPLMETTSGESGFRANHGEELGFFMEEDWDPGEAPQGEVEDFVRSVNRQLAMYNQKTEGKDVFQDHTVFPSLEARELRDLVAQALDEGELDGIDLESNETEGSFYTVCSHPTEDNEKRTFLNGLADLDREEMTLTLGYPCEEGGKIIAEPGEIDEVLQEVL